MRHGKKFNHLGRKPAHRKAMLSNMASSLIMEKRISTTVAKAKELRKYVEPLLTKSKTDDTNSRRVVFSYLQNKESVSELFNEVADKIATRAGGYTRILKTGHRLGDNADMCIIELVDYNDVLLKEAKPEKAKTRRSRRGKGESDKDAPATKPVEAVEVEEAAVDVETEDAVVEEVAETATEVAPVEIEEAPVEETPEVEAATEEVVEEVPEVEAVEESPAEETPEVEAATEEVVEEVLEDEAVEESPVEAEVEPDKTETEVEEEAADQASEEETPQDEATDEEEKKD